MLSKNSFPGHYHRGWLYWVVVPGEARPPHRYSAELHGTIQIMLSSVVVSFHLRVLACDRRLVIRQARRVTACQTNQSINQSPGAFLPQLFPDLVATVCIDCHQNRWPKLRHVVDVFGCLLVVSLCLDISSTLVGSQVRVHRL